MDADDGVNSTLDHDGVEAQGIQLHDHPGGLSHIEGGLPYPIDEEAHLGIGPAPCPADLLLDQLLEPG